MNQPRTLNKWRIFVFTAFALIAFAANSVLNRLALGGNTIDAGSYIGIRLASGALTLLLLNGIDKRDFKFLKNIYLDFFGKNFLPAFYLFAYGVAFSFAYRSLSSGTGAFILFGTVQTTMLSTALLKGERPYISEWIGLSVAIMGLVYLVFPGLSAPDPLGAFLMIIAGITWGFYTLKGRGVKDPLESTALNFIISVPMVLALNAFTFSNSHVTTEGCVYALISGALTSGVGYAIWYAALRGLTTTQAAFLQLFVPVIAALGGILFLSENITTRLIGAGMLIIGGVVLALMGKRYWGF
jgi:drug/metabolite transporter (DMT)-like permease